MTCFCFALLSGNVSSANLYSVLFYFTLLLQVVEANNGI